MLPLRSIAVFVSAGAGWLLVCSCSRPAGPRAEDFAPSGGDAGAVAQASGPSATGDPGDPSSEGADDAGPQAAPEPDGAPPPGFVITNETLVVAGTPRSYLLATPDTYDASRVYPLVLAFHGNPGTPDKMLGTFPSSGQDAIVAYPAGLDDAWDLDTPPAANLDVAFVSALPADIASKRSVDVARVFGWGMSGGAFFLNQYVCRVPGTFRAFASMAGGAPYAQAGDTTLPNGCIACAGAPTPALMMQGTADTVVDPSGSSYGASCWAAEDSCASPDVTTWPSVTPTPCQASPGCSVELCMIPGLGHAIWTHAADAAWSFFASVSTH